jgi:hypothetical protein
MITVYEWTLERLENSERAAQAKSGAEREGWLEDVAYWQLVNQAIAESPLAHTTPDDQAQVGEENRMTTPKAAGSAFLRVTIETHDSKLEMDTRCCTARFIEARAVEAIRAGCVGLLVASPNAELCHREPKAACGGKDK